MTAWLPLPPIDGAGCAGEPLDKTETATPNRANADAHAIASRLRALPVALRSWEREHWMLATLTASTIALIAAIAPGFANATLHPETLPRVVQELPLPEPEPIVIEASPDAVLAEAPAAEPMWRSVEVQRGQTMGNIFASLSLSGATLQNLLKHPGAKESLTRIHPGKRFEFLISPEGALQALRFERDESSVVTLHLDQGKVSEQVEQRDMQVRIAMRAGEIRDSLYNAGAKAGLSNGTIVEMAKVFGYDIDFAQDLRVGDHFSVVYEEVYRDGERLRGGDILAATFINQGKRYTAFRYEFADGRREYFDETGRPLRKSFMRTPVEFTRISSVFSAARKHPILGRTRAHQGVDYAAPSGTPIMAAGEGRVSFAGWQNGYGRTIVIDHGRGYTTLYGHMSKLGKYKTGARVQQGATIGYVGMTGLASGPHLHYEFRINGAHRDPLKVTMPKPEPLPRAELARFSMQTQPLLAKLELMDGSRKLAKR